MILLRSAQDTWTTLIVMWVILGGLAMVVIIMYLIDKQPIKVNDMEKHKFVRLAQYNQVIIFPCVMEHSTFKYLNPVTAGFCYINTSHQRVDCFGDSISLGLRSDKKEDSFQATKQFFGFDAAMKLVNRGEVE